MVPFPRQFPVTWWQILATESRYPGTDLFCQGHVIVAAGGLCPMGWWFVDSVHERSPLGLYVILIVVKVSSTARGASVAG